MAKSDQRCQLDLFEWGCPEGNIMTSAKRPAITVREVLEMEFEVAEMALARGDQDAAEHALCLIDSFYLLHLDPDVDSGSPTLH